MRNHGTAKEPRTRGKSSTKEILGLANGGQKIHPRFIPHFERLTQLRDQFAGTKSTRTENARDEMATSSEHMADGATDSYDRDWALALLSSAQNALYEIDQALKRIHEGTFGICEVTGKPIEGDRLKAIPWTRFCAAAQSHLEVQGGGGRTHLGKVGSYREAGESETLAYEDAEELVAVGAEK